MTPNKFQLLPFQQTASDRAVNERKHFILFRMGLGKTPTTTVSLYRVEQEMVLILCPKNAMRVWEDHIKEWFAGLDAISGKTTRVVIHRWRKKYANRDARLKMWQQRVPDAVNVYIMTYAGFIFDQPYIPHQFTVIINDEAKRIRDYKSKAFKALKQACKFAKFYWPMTGTPGHMPQHMWTMFHLADPKYYGSYWKFVSAFQYVIKNEWGRQEVLPSIRNPEQWRKTLHSRASVVTKEDVKDQFSFFPKQRQILSVEMDEEQERLYRQLEKDMMTDDGSIIVQNTMVQTLRFRQILVCPKIVKPDCPSYGAAIEDLIETLADTDPHVVIFTPFTEAIPHFRERLHKAGYAHVIQLRGGITPDEQQDRIKYFRQNRGIAICSTTYAEAFSLEPASEAFHIGYDFNPEVNDQAEDRLERLTTTYPVTHYYYAYEDTYDYQQADIVIMKRERIKATFGIG